MRLLASALLMVMVVLLGGCGSDDEPDASSGTVPTTAPMAWGGPPKPAEDGAISVAGFNEYAQQELPASKLVPRDMAIEFLQAQQPYKLTLDTSRAGGTTVTVLKDNLEDDSVRAQRHILEFALFSGGVVNLSSARVEYKCHANRGHQDFSPELCL